MNKIVSRDIRPPRLYEPIREDMRRHVIGLKKRRRLSIGPNVTLVFENRATVIFQIEEMLRTEQLEEASQIDAEIAVYNDLIPDEGQLSATLFIEIVESSEIKPTLRNLLGLDQHVFLHLGEHAIRAVFEPGAQEEERIAAVQYVRFSIAKEAEAALRDVATRAYVKIDHPKYDHLAEVGADLRQELLADLG